MRRQPIIVTPPQHAPALSLSDLEYYAQGWKLDGDVRMLAKSYVEKRRDCTAKLLWFLRSEGYSECGVLELRAFFSYLRSSHERPEGRWGNDKQRRALSAGTFQMWHAMLRGFFNFVVAEGALEVSPMQRLKAPIARPDQVQPFSEDQQRALVEAARETRYHTRNVALILFLLDTGCRASEVCGIVYGDLSLEERSCRVLGKGNKERTVCFGAMTARALYTMLHHQLREPDSPLFQCGIGKHAGEALTRYGLKELFRDLSRRAGIRGVRVSPHTCRHTAALNYLRAGGDGFSLQMMLGHTSQVMTSRYINLARADLQEQYRRLSPLDRVMRPERDRRR